MKRILFTWIVLIITLNCLHADVYMKQNRHTDALKIMGQTQPAQDVVEEVWITNEGFRSDNCDQSMIYQKSSNKMIMADHKTKTYHEINLNNMNMDELAGAGDDEDAEGFNNMMKSMMQMEVAVTPTSESRKIGDWKCKKYLMTMNMAMGKTVMEIWASEDLKIDPKLYDQFNAGMLAAMPGMQQAAGKIEQEMKKIKGVKVLTLQSVQMMGQEIKSEIQLLEFRERPAPADLYKTPAGYKKQTR